MTGSTLCRAMLALSMAREKGFVLYCKDLAQGVSSGTIAKVAYSFSSFTSTEHAVIARIAYTSIPRRFDS